MIDVNGTRFHLLLTENDWLGDAVPTDVRWNVEAGALELKDRLFVFPPRKSKGPLDFNMRRGAGADSYGNWYFIGPDSRELRFVPLNQSQSQHFWSPADEVAAASSGDFHAITPPGPEVVTMTGAAVTRDHYLVVGTTLPKGLLIFDLYGGGAPSTLVFPADMDFEPFDIAATKAGGVVILDCKHQRYWKLNCHFGIEPLNELPPAAPRMQDFQFASGGSLYRSEDVAPHIRIEESAVLSAIDPVAIEALPCGDVLVLDNIPALGYSVVRRFHGSTDVGNVPLDAATMTLTDDGATVDALLGYDLAFLAPDTVYIMSAEGEQVFAFKLGDDNGFSLTLLPKYFPIRRFSGRALVAANGTVFYDFGERWLPIVEQPRPRYKETAQIHLPPDIAKQTQFFDGKLPDCVWHRLFLDACIPPGARVLVESRASNSPELLDVAVWRPEPGLQLRPEGPEIPFYTPALQGSSDRTGTWELLFQNAVGRYLQLRLTLQGTGRNSPRLQALRAYYPRFSYLKRYLPAVYQQDATSASFLDRFLANPEGIFTELEAKIEQAQGLFDPHTLGAEYLDWLASWLGATLDVSWSESTRRLFIEHAHELFPQRGTPNGMLRMLHLALDPQPSESLFQGCSCGCGQASGTAGPGFNIQLVESFLTRSLPEGAFGDLQGAVAGTVASSGVAAHWTAAQGAGALDQIYRDWLTSLGRTVDSALQFPAIQPADPAQAADWITFTGTQFAFRYGNATSNDLSLYREFLAHKYVQPSALSKQYGLTGNGVLTSFSQVDTRLWPALRNSLPDNPTQLADWITFVALALPVSRAAHRFVVLVPVGENDDLPTQTRKLQLAMRVAETEKPAHTQVDVRLYWAMFRVGEARVGRETILGKSSRFTAIQLGASYLGSSYLAYGPPWDITSRMVVGRDQVQKQEQIV